MPFGIAGCCIVSSSVALISAPCRFIGPPDSNGQAWYRSRVKRKMYHDSMPKHTFGIGEVARRAGVSPDLIRYYERVGLLPAAPRPAGRYRYYSEQALGRVLLVRKAIRFGFSSKELSRFLKARDCGLSPCTFVRAAGQRLLSEMDEELAQLGQARTVMAETLA